MSAAIAIALGAERTARDSRMCQTGRLFRANPVFQPCHDNTLPFCKASGPCSRTWIANCPGLEARSGASVRFYQARARSDAAGS
jgi:hypothetical protein